MLKCTNKLFVLILSLSSSAWSMDNHLDHTAALHDGHQSHQVGRKYELKFERNTDNYSKMWLERNHPNFKQKTLKATAAVLPKTVDMRKQCSPVVDQGQLGSCTANAGCGAVEFNLMKQKAYSGPMSRLFLYYNERKIEGTVTEDSGATIADIIKSLVEQGVCHESMWPYSDDTTTFKKQPTKACYQEALHYTDLDNTKIAAVSQEASTIKNVLAKGNPILFGIMVYSSFESSKVATTGLIPMPNVNTEQLLGGHALMMVGYDDTDNTFLVRNSWGTSWGMSGYCKFPQKYILDRNLSSDFWSINQIGPKSQPTPPKPSDTKVKASEILAQLTEATANVQKIQLQLSNFVQTLS